MQHQVGNELITCVEMDSLVRVTMVPCSRMYKDAAHVMLMWTAGSFSRQSFGLGCAVNSSRGDRGIRHVHLGWLNRIVSRNGPSAGTKKHHGVAWSN